MAAFRLALRLADRQASRRIAHRFEVLEVAVRMTRLAFGRRTEHRGHVVVSLDVGLGCEIQVTTIRLRLASECVLQILFGLAAFEVHGSLLIDCPVENCSHLDLV